MPFTSEAVTACLFLVASVLWWELLTYCRSLLLAVGCVYGLAYCGWSAGLWLVRWSALP